MSKVIEIETDRLRLRQWKKEDFPGFAELNADVEVMKYYPDIMSELDSNDMAQRFEASLARRGWGYWVVEKPGEEKFMGFVGLNEPDYDLPVSPCVEIGWRLARKYWKQGFASEAANAVLKQAFENFGFTEIYSFTSVLNKKSQAVMERIGMINMNMNFEHPMIPKNSQLREHVLFKINKRDCAKNNHR